MISKFNVGLKTLSEPEFYCDLVYKFKKLIRRNDFSLQFRNIIAGYRRTGYNLNVMRQSACLISNPIIVDNYAAFFNCTPVCRASDYTMGQRYSFYLIWAGASCLLRGPPGFNWCFSFAPELVSYFAHWDLHRRAAYLICEFSFLIHHGGDHDLFVCP